MGDSEDGKPEFLKTLENYVAKAEDIDFPHDSWKDLFITDWLKLSPPLSDIDLRPLLYLSRDKAKNFASYDELSPEGREVLSALCDTTKFFQKIIADIKKIGLIESEIILTRMIRRARKKQWENSVIVQTLQIPKAYPELAPLFISMLDEIPPERRSASIIPLIRKETWAQGLLSRWVKDDSSPQLLKKAITVARRNN